MVKITFSASDLVACGIDAAEHAKSVSASSKEDFIHKMAERFAIRSLKRDYRWNKGHGVWAQFELPREIKRFKAMVWDSLNPDTSAPYAGDFCHASQWSYSNALKEMEQNRVYSLALKKVIPSEWRK